MSKLSIKFLISIAVILLIVGSLSVYLNSNFIQRYYLYQQKQELYEISDTVIESTQNIDATKQSIEENTDAAVISFDFISDNDKLNAQLREEFLLKGISFQKYWLWDEDQRELLDKGRKTKVYRQDKFGYSLLIEYLLIKNELVAIAKIVPSLDKTLNVINIVTVVVFAGAGLLLFLSIFVLVHRITSPIKKIREVSYSIANSNFETLEIHTNDELELLAQDINAMSRQLQSTHSLLLQKNTEMEQLLANVSHDLKTPISLIKMYASGIKDGLDDGSFLDTIIKQNNKMQSIVEKLLLLAKVKQQETEKQDCNASELLINQISDYQHHTIKTNIQNDIIISVSCEDLYFIYSNMLSNAVKYSAGETITVSLYRDENDVNFAIQNAFNNQSLDLERIWEPFYLGAESRNDSLSGTGLGLSIVKAVCEKNNISYRCQVSDNIIKFELVFKHF